MVLPGNIRNNNRQWQLVSVEVRDTGGRSAGTCPQHGGQQTRHFRRGVVQNFQRIQQWHVSGSNVGCSDFVSAADVERRNICIAGTTISGWSSITSFSSLAVCLRKGPCMFLSKSREFLCSSAVSLQRFLGAFQVGLFDKQHIRIQLCSDVCRGMIEYRDNTDILVNQGYWPSYNVP